MKAQTTLITGGDGYIGRKIARKLLENENQTVSLWIRAADSAEFKPKGQQLCHDLCDIAGRLRLSWGDLRSEDPFSQLDPQEIGTILHTAAVTRFNVEREVARSVNVEGTLKLLRFAEQCPNLQQFLLLSSIYASGLKQGKLAEESWGNSEGFSNFYEWSKWAAEQELLNNHSNLPWKILRVATIIADSNNGDVVQQNAFHNTLKLIYYGFLSILPGRPETPLYFVTGDFVKDAVYRLLQNGETTKIYHVAHTRNESLTLGRLIDLIFEVYEADEAFRKKRILKPLYSDAESFQLLVDAVHQFGGGIVNQAVSSVAPFSRQLYLQKDVQNQNLVDAMPLYAAPDPAELIRKTSRFLAQTRWGRK